MKRIITTVLSILFLAACTTMTFAEIKEGLWEMKTTVEMKGMSIQVPPTTTRTCINKNDMVPKPPAQGKGQEQECKIKEQKVTGDTVSYAMECTGKGGMSTEISGEMTYTGDSMAGKSTMKVKGPASMEMSTQITGKYIGPCTK
jgi:hypothetical protein